MGKYLRKAKITGDVAVMEVSQATLGVRTRARTLALQRLQSSTTTTPPPSSSDTCYLQLRSRRLEKPKTKVSEEHPESDSRQNSKPISHSRFLVSSAKSGSVSISQKDGFEDVKNRGRVTEDVDDLEPRDRSTRESTPCSLVREADAMVNSGSVTRQTELNTTAQRTRNSILRNIPSVHEIEEFFTFAEQQQQHLFMEKYNFDVANDLPLSGRYEWIRVNH
ncbi:hypothetical protein K7X08_016309 [Anisodus acutangulus]|uniref:Cyclin-dependent kinase inhibitor n=1 Tax=Anisodus acutangulus TaxID=402998 RepID=A0A9Q1LDX8_9SOLA|nr:hypothetical protein K7X08_016309 [Anisodus acutangulus]